MPGLLLVHPTGLLSNQFIEDLNRLSELWDILGTGGKRAKTHVF
jgi:hypothetical protein